MYMPRTYGHTLMSSPVVGNYSQQKEKKNNMKSTIKMKKKSFFMEDIKFHDESAHQD